MMVTYYPNLSMKYCIRSYIKALRERPGDRYVSDEEKVEIAQRKDWNGHCLGKEVLVEGTFEEARYSMKTEDTLGTIGNEERRVPASFVVAWPYPLHMISFSLLEKWTHQDSSTVPRRFLPRSRSTFGYPVPTRASAWQSQGYVCSLDLSFISHTL